MELKPYVRQAQYYETDQMGVIHHVNYIHWMEEARVDDLDQSGFGYRAMEEQGISSPVLRLECSYLRSTAFGETVEIRLRMARYNGVRMVLDYEMREKESGQLRLTARSEHCFLKGGRPVSLKRVCPAYDQVFRAMQEETAEG